MQEKEHQRRMRKAHPSGMICLAWISCLNGSEEMARLYGATEEGMYVYSSLTVCESKPVMTNSKDRVSRTFISPQRQYAVTFCILP
jgi:hypothetical protein